MANYKYHYQNAHSENDESKRRDIEQMKSLLDSHNLYPSDKNAKILELGVGMGRLMLALHEAKYINVTGVEIDKALFEIAKAEGLKVVLADAMDFLKKSKEKYDAILAFDFIEHIAKEKQIECLELMKQHLVDDGFVALQTPNALCPTFEFFRYADHTHNISFTAESLSYCLHNAGLHSFAIRPHMQESERVQELKLPWARIYREEYGLRDFILTPHLFCIAFYSESAFYKWFANVLPIDNNYSEPSYNNMLKRLSKLFYCHKTLTSNRDKYWFVTFGDSRMRCSARRIKNQAKQTNIFKKIFVLNEKNLSRKFRHDFPQMKFGSRGYGYWVWKPRVILNVLKQMQNGETMLFCDIGCHINSKQVKELLTLFQKCEKSQSGILGFQSALKIMNERYWSKGDLLDYFLVRANCKVLDTSQFASGLIFIQKRANTIQLIRDWLKVYYDNFHLVDDTPSISPNLSEFRENRHDQSIFSILMKLRGGDTIIGEHDNMFYSDIGIDPRSDKLWDDISFPIQIRRDLDTRK